MARTDKERADFYKGVRAAIAYLHDYASGMNDPHAKAILNTAAFSLGVNKPDPNTRAPSSTLDVERGGVPEGWVMTPFHCTMEMIKAGEAEYADPLPVSGPDGEDADWISPIQAAWYAMIAAAPSAGGEG